jgi:hypothetical protein
MVMQVFVIATLITNNLKTVEEVNRCLPLTINHSPSYENISRILSKKLF